MSTLLGLFFGEPGIQGSRKRKRDDSTSASSQRELKSRRTGEQDKATSFFDSLLGPVRNLWANLTTATMESSLPQEDISTQAREEKSPSLEAGRVPRFKMAPKLLGDEAPSSREPFVLPRRNVVPRASLVEASPFVPAPLTYQVREVTNRSPSTPARSSSNDALIDQKSRSTPIFTSPFRFSFAPSGSQRESLRCPVNRRTLTNERPSKPAPPAHKTYLEQMEENEQVSSWESMLSSITDEYEKQPQQVVLREQQKKLHKLQAQSLAEDLPFEYTEKPLRRTVPVVDHDYELARNAERRRVEQKLKEVAQQTKEPIMWPRFPSIPADLSTTKAPYDREEDYGLLSLFHTEDDAQDWEEQYVEKVKSDEEESDVSGSEEMGRYYEKGTSSIWRDEVWTTGDHDESDLDLADEFYDVDVDEIDMEAIQTEIAIKRLIQRKLNEQRKKMDSYNISVEEKMARITQTQRQLRKLAKEYKKEMRRKMEEQRLLEEIERRKKHTFSKDELALIKAALKGRDNEIVTSGFNADLKKSDIRRLRDTEWLNDEVINFYLELLKERNSKLGAAAPKCHFFNTFFYPLLMDNGKYNYPRVRGWTRKVDVFAMDKVVVPVHMGNHWCLAIINFKEKRFEYYDSLGSSNNPCLKTLRRYLMDESMDKRKKPIDLSEWQDHQPKEIPLQKNGYDCGVFMCKYADCASAGRPFLFKQLHMPYFRQLMILEIVQKRCSPISF